MTPAETLRGAAALLSKPGAWTRGTFARDAAGKPCNTHDEAATCWCVRGALARVGGWQGALDAEIALERTLGSPFLARWNDCFARNAQEVVAKLNEAAEQLEAKP